MQEVYPELLEELQKLVASPLITETEFPATFLRSFAASGIETKLKNHVFHLMRSKCVEKWIQVCFWKMFCFFSIWKNKKDLKFEISYLENLVISQNVEREQFPGNPIVGVDAEQFPGTLL